MSSEIAIRAACLMDRAPGPLLAQLACDRSQTPEEAQVWKRMAESLERQLAAERRLFMRTCAICLPSPDKPRAALGDANTSTRKK